MWVKTPLKYCAKGKDPRFAIDCWITSGSYARAAFELFDKPLEFRCFPTGWYVTNPFDAAWLHFHIGIKAVCYDFLYQRLSIGFERFYLLLSNRNSPIKSFCFHVKPIGNFGLLITWWGRKYKVDEVTLK